MIRIAFPTPSWPTLPYIPERTYATASPTAIRMPSNFCAPFLGRKRKNHHEEHRAQDAESSLSYRKEKEQLSAFEGTFP